MCGGSPLCWFVFEFNLVVGYLLDVGEITQERRSNFITLVLPSVVFVVILFYSL